ncbi:hypothetical protein [Streptomyces alkaliterrae]|uniref:LPXTG cell wall anchor domain-containing protein n=1 Tax=Streptomyces alkaliterrae TaxID=2213162 RepID=A0A5P0YR68_9ACTN|nr:hypothetical protein [Streptomyces alkaliterrae]MBB1254185.1 hypothetical protein [Streptomyces alkaliterrae]MBB1259887.1 hypothetical protein [Streptomyces alkaliterrae]MQS02813.1 hypothetical protein [Streptomyces alkaliterrae]
MKTRSLATVAAASAALVLSMAGPALAGGETGAGGLTVHPSTAGPGATVQIKAHCKEGGHGTVASDAFESSQAHTGRHHHGRHHHDGRHHDGRHHEHDGVMQDDGKRADGVATHHPTHKKGHHHHAPFASAKVMHEGLTPGKTYQVTGYCKNHKPLTGTFTFSGVSGGAHAGLGGLASGTQSTGGGMSTTTTAAAAAGGLALAGVAGYLMIWRRRANADKA